MRILNQLITIVLVLCGLAITSLNTNSVTFNYYFGNTNLPLSLLVVFSVGFGVFLGVGLNLLRYMRLKNAYQHLQKQSQPTIEVKEAQSVL